jgi:hypothetical protein
MCEPVITLNEGIELRGKGKREMAGGRKRGKGRGGGHTSNQYEPL